MATSVAQQAKPLPAQEDQIEVFISYSRHDAEFVERLEGLLVESGIHVWLDKDDIPPGADWRDEIRDGIERSDTLLVVVSPDSAASEECTKEIDRASGFGKRIVPILCREVDPAEVQPVVAARNWISWLSNDETEVALAKIDDALQLDIEWARNHTRINGQALRWDRQGRDQSALTRGKILEEDERLVAIARPEEQPQPTELMRTFLQESRLAATRRARRNLLVSIAVTAIMSVIATIAVQQYLEATRQRESTQSRALAAQAASSISDERDLAALLALESVRVANTTDARASLLRVLATPDRFQRRIDVHDAPITATAISADGTVAATGDEAGAVWIWDVDPAHPIDPATPRLEVLLEADTPVAELLITELDGEEGWFLVAASDSGIGVMWQASDGLEWDAVATPTVLRDVALSPDIALMAGYVDGLVTVYDAASQEQLVAAVLPSSENATLFDLTFSPDGSLLAWGDGNALFVWNWTEEPDVELVAEFFTAVTSLEFSHDGSILAVGEFEGNISLIDTFDGTVGEVFPAPVNAVVDLAFAPPGDPFDPDAGRLLASAHSNGDVNLSVVFGVEGFIDETLAGHKEVTTSVTFGAEGQLASGDFNGEVIWWNAVPQVALGLPLPSSGERHLTDLTTVAFIDNEHIVSLDSLGGAIETGLVDEIGSLAVEPPDTSVILALDAANGVVIAAGLDTGELLLVESGSSTVLETSHGAAIDVVALSADGNGLVTASSGDGRVVIWDRAARRERRVIEPPDVVVGTALHSGGDTVWLGVATARGAKALRVDVLTGATTAEKTVNDDPREGVSALALSADEEWLAVGVTDRKIRMLDAETMQEQLPMFEGHREVVTGIAFTDADETLLSGDAAGIVHVWDVSGRRLITDLIGPADGVTDLAVSADGTRLAVASEDDSAFAWVLDADVWVERACALAGRNMTESEWALFGTGDSVRHCAQYDDGSGPGLTVDDYETERLVD